VSTIKVVLFAHSTIDAGKRLNVQKPYIRLYVKKKKKKSKKAKHNQQERKQQKK